MNTCEYDGCNADAVTVDAEFNSVCGLHRQIPLLLMDTGRNLRDISPLAMSENELDASMGDLLKTIAAKQSDAWAAQHEAAQWKSFAEWLATQVKMNEREFWKEARRRGIES